MEQKLAIYAHHKQLREDFVTMTADGWVVHQMTQTSNSGGGTHLWTVVWQRGARLSPEALAYLAACPDPTIAGEATRLIMDRMR